MTIAALGFVIWGVFGLVVYLFGAQLKAFVTKAVLFSALIMMGLIGVVRFLLDVVTFVAKAAVETLMFVVREVTLLVCKLLPPEQQEEWTECCTDLALWAKKRSKLVFIEDDAPDAASDKTRKPEQPQEHASAYDWALKIMGLENETDLTLPKLKQRYRQMMTVVHPDKQFPNHVFAQQVNDSVETIKRHHGWQ